MNDSVFMVPRARSARHVLTTLAIVLAFLGITALPALAFNFGPGSYYGVGGDSLFGEAVDLNADGYKDFAVGNRGAISILINRRDGTFYPFVYYRYDSNLAGEVAVADYNGDASPDIAVNNYTSSGVTLFFNDGQGVFGSPIFFSTGPSPLSITTGNLNGDQAPDLAVALHNLDQAEVYFNDGSGVFVPGPVIDTGDAADLADIVSDDLDGNGLDDLAVAKGDVNQVGIALNQGGGSFGQVTHYDARAIDFGPHSIELGDVNADGLPDVLSANFGASISVFLNAGEGRFGEPVVVSTGEGVRDVGFGDLDADGLPELIAAFQSRDLAIYKNRGSASFDFAMRFEDVFAPFTVLAPDLNNDGALDVAAITDVETVYVYLNAARPSIVFSPAVNFGEQKVATTSQVQTVVLTNSGDANLLVRSVAIGRPNAGDFQVVSENCTDGPVPPTSSCSIGVTFNPQHPGRKQAELTITDNAPGSPHIVVLSGRAHMK